MSDTVIAPLSDTPTEPAPAEAVLSARNIGKAYSTTVSGSRARRGRDIWAAIFQRRPREIANPKDAFWAVRDVSLTLMPGESLGVVGRNGAGKTTLMKMLSGILTPDAGNLSIRGQVQAMVNLSGGIDKTLSGSQNIENAAALRGLTAKQLKAVRTDIIAFAELEDSIDRLVSTYSSGMKARLGFAICVHMDPALIVIDEALAVGDTRFKQKCLRKLNEMRAGGVAMVLVSHSMGQVRQFCDRVIWIDGGEVKGDGPAEDVILQYQEFLDTLDDQLEDSKQSAQARARRDYDDGKLPTCLEDLGERTNFIRNVGPFGQVVLDSEWMESVELDLTGGNSFKPLSPLDAKLTFTVKKPISRFNFGLRIYTDTGQIAAGHSSLGSFEVTEVGKGKHTAHIEFDQMPLAPGTYHIVVSLNNGREKLFRSVCKSFHVLAGSDDAWNAPVVIRSSCRILAND